MSLRDELPFDPDAELAVLGCMLVESKTVPAVVDVLGDGEAFLVPDNKRLYGYIREVHDKGGPLDLIVMNNRLVGTEKPGPDTWEEYMIRAAETIGSWERAEAYAHIVLENHHRRQLMIAGERLRDSVVADTVISAADIARDHMDHVKDILSQTKGLALHTLKDDIEDVKELFSQDSTMIGTGIDVVDGHVGGIDTGEVCVIAARPSVGKTAMALSMMYSMLCRKIPACFMSVEMSKKMIITRLVSLDSGVPTSDFREGRIPPARRLQLLENMEKKISFSEHGIISYQENDIDALVGLARRAVAEHGVRVIFVDYLQLIILKGESRRRHTNRNHEISYISSSLKNLANQTNTALVLVSQLSRDGAGGRPELHHLRDSGAIEQDADQVWFLYRDRNDRSTAVHWYVAKNRQGAAGADERLNFHPEVMRAY